MCRSAQPPKYAQYVEWYTVRPNCIPFNQALRSVGLWPLRGRNGTNAHGTVYSSAQNRLIQIHEELRQFYHYLLMNTENGHQGLTYLYDRGLSKETLDAFIDVMKQIAKEALHQPEMLRQAPHSTPVRRLDDVKAVKDAKFSF